LFSFTIFVKVSFKAIQAPLIDAVLVPPSASRTSQSTVKEYPLIIPKLKKFLIQKNRSTSLNPK